MSPVEGSQLHIFHCLHKHRIFHTLVENVIELFYDGKRCPLGSPDEETYVRDLLIKKIVS